MNRKKGGCHFNYFALCLPWIIMNFVGILMDIGATIYYFNHYFKLSKDISYILELMEVKNYEVVGALLKDLRVNLSFYISATSSALKMVCMTSKGVIPLIVLLSTGLMSIKSMWEVVKENKRLQMLFKRNPIPRRL